MRSVQVIGKISEDKVSEMESHYQEDNGFYPDDGDIEYVCSIPMPAFIDVLTMRSERKMSCFRTVNAHPHTDDALYAYTLGIVMRGNHKLFSGKKRNIVDDVLDRGAVFVINNRTLHGAMPAIDGVHLLAFATIDFDADNINHAISLVSVKE
jgi:hypothetical protein